MPGRVDLPVWKLLRRAVFWYLNYGCTGLGGPALRQQRTMNILSPLVAASGSSYAFLFLWVDAQGLWPAALVVGLFVLFLGVPMLYARNASAGMLFAGLLTTFIQTILAWLLGRDSGLHLFLFAIPAIGIVCFGAAQIRVISAMTLVAVIAMIVSGFSFANPAPFIRADPGLLAILQASAYLIVSGFVLVSVFVGFQRAEWAEDSLQSEHARSEALLYNLLPESIATRLKAKPDRTIADSLPQVAILFADIVDFTPRSADMKPEEIVDFLNRIFSVFDELTEKHGLEKIKTIGDAYMVAAGVPDACPDPVHRVAEMALDMLDVTAALPGRVEVRIGLHTGPAVAGVIGNRKLFYDVWGETVNTASRMETHGEPSRIQATEAVRAELAGDHLFAPRGTVAVKGMGQVQTWWLTGRVAD